MSSDLLQQAMIDAAALKEAAIKNAENALIEKYSQEFNQTVQKLLEQEEVAAPTDLNAAPADATQAPVDIAASDPMSDTSLPVADMGNDAFSKVPGAFSGTNEDELITINFDQIRTALNEMLGYQTNQDGTPDSLAQGKAPISLSEYELEEGEEEEIELEDSDEENVVHVTISDEQTDSDEHTAVLSTADDEGEQLEWELEEADDSSGASSDPQVMKAKEKLAGIEGQKATAQKELGNAEVQALKKQQELEKQKMASNASSMSSMSLEENIELTEEELEELAEELRVDLKVGNLSDGYMGSTETQKREQRNVELAAARDEEATKQREQELEKMKDLTNENKDLKVMNNKLLSALEQLKLQLEKLNLSNAKLLYTNKALGNISLNERQKEQIAESISKADSVLAAKTIYETLQNAVETKVKEKEAPQSLREALNRASTPFAVKKSATNSLNDLMAERMKALAGIKK
jgi:hypothetical protein